MKNQDKEYKKKKTLLFALQLKLRKKYKIWKESERKIIILQSIVLSLIRAVKRGEKRRMEGNTSCRSEWDKLGQGRGEEWWRNYLHLKLDALDIYIKTKTKQSRLIIKRNWNHMRNAFVRSERFYEWKIKMKSDEKEKKIDLMHCWMVDD